MNRKEINNLLNLAFAQAIEEETEATTHTVKIDPNDERYSDIYERVRNNSGNDSLFVIAKAESNRKPNEITPFEVRNGVFFYIARDLGDGMVSYVATPTVDEVFVARSNTVRKAKLGNMFEILAGGGRRLYDFDDSDSAMIILTNDENMNGAGILSCREYMKAIKEKFGDCYILPSSIHEILIAPKELTGGNKAEMTDMVQDVNRTQVSDNEYLADRAFDIDEWL